LLFLLGQEWNNFFIIIIIINHVVVVVVVVVVVDPTKESSGIGGERRRMLSVGSVWAVVCFGFGFCLGRNGTIIRWNDEYEYR
jgi:hypothetical protein